MHKKERSEINHQLTFYFKNKTRTMPYIKENYSLSFLLIKIVVSQPLFTLKQSMQIPFPY